jgi:hypothetical protein
VYQPAPSQVVAPNPAEPQRFEPILQPSLVPPAPATPSPQTFERKTFTPLAAAPKKRRFTVKRKPKTPEDRKAKAQLAAVMVVIVGLAIGANIFLTGKQYAYNRQGTKITISDPTSTPKTINSSCFTVNLPANFKPESIGGCNIQFGKDGGLNGNSTISIASNLASDTYTLDSAPNKIKIQFGAAADIESYTHQTIMIDGVKAVQIIGKVKNLPTRAMVYIPNLPARYFSGTSQVGSFLISGNYDTPGQRADFGAALASLRWNK